MVVKGLVSVKVVKLTEQEIGTRLTLFHKCSLTVKLGLKARE